MLTNIGYKWYYRVWKYDCFVDLVPVPYKLKNHSIQLQQNRYIEKIYDFKFKIASKRLQNIQDFPALKHTQYPYRHLSDVQMFLRNVYFNCLHVPKEF